MQFKKFLSGVSALAIAASAFAAMSVTASAKTVGVQYLNGGNEIPSPFVYDTDTYNKATVYTTQTDLSEGTNGVLTITYKCSADYNNSSCRAGIKFDDQTIYVNAVGSSTAQGISGGNGTYYINFVPQVNESSNPVTVTLTATLNSEGNVSALKINATTSSGGTSTKDDITFSPAKDISTITLVTAYRGGDSTEYKVNLTDFSASFSSYIASEITSIGYETNSNYYTYDTTGSGLLNTGSETTAKENAIAAKDAGVTENYIVGRVYQFTATPNDDMISVTVSSENHPEQTYTASHLTGYGGIVFAVVATKAFSNESDINFADFASSQFSLTKTVE